MKNAILALFLVIMGFAYAQETETEKAEWDGTIPVDAWISWGVGGAIMLFVLFAIVWTCQQRCTKSE